MSVQHQEYQVYFTDDNTSGGNQAAAIEVGTNDPNGLNGDMMILNPYGPGCSVVGIDTTYVPPGTEQVFYNAGPDDVTIKHQSGAATSPGYALNMASGADFVLPAGNLLWGIRISGHGWRFDDAGQ